MDSSVLSYQQTKTFLKNKPPALSLIHFNVRSLRKHHNDLIHFLTAINHTFSVICLSETWLTNNDGNLYGISNYTSEYCNRDSARGGGSAVFIDSSLSYRRRHDLSFTNLNCESVWLEFDQTVFSLNGRNTIIASIYRSPSSSIVHFCSQLESLLNLLVFENKNVIICGDININILDLYSHSCSDYVRVFQSFGFSSLITAPTRCDPSGTNTLIDHILSSLTTSASAAVIDYQFSDHYPVFLRIESALLPRATNHKQVMKAVFNTETFVSLINQLDWSDVTQNESAEQAYDSFSALIANCITQSTSHVPISWGFKERRNPWITNGLLHSISKKDKMHKKLKDQPFNTVLQIRYKKYSNTLGAILKRAKRDYFQTRILLNGTDTKRNWQLIKKFLNKTDSHARLTKISTASSTFTEPIDIANAFNDHFANTENNQHRPSLSHLSRCPQSFYLYPTSSAEVRSVISSLKTTGAGLDSIHPSRVKLIIDCVSPVLANIINKMFKDGTFPTSLKNGKITPVFKKGDRECINNYRPICILPFFSKVIEKILYKRLMSYFKKFDLLSPHQFGFRPGFSTELALISFTDKIKLAIDDGSLFGAVFVDLTKAFDTINHSILFHKLASYGITGPALSLIKNYLKNRSQVVQIDGSVSSPKVTNTGVPQGSILGPLLFLLFINDLPLTLRHTDCLLYADDTTIYSSHKSIAVLLQNLNVDLKNVSDWCSRNCLHINPTKTTFVIFHSPLSKVPPVVLTMGDNEIPVTNSARFLGVTLDEHLKYNIHVHSLMHKVSFGIHVIIKSRNYFERPIIRSLYHSFIHSHLSYCVSSWANTYFCHLDSLQRLQNQAIRLMTFSNVFTPSKPLYQNLNILPLSELLKQKLSLFIFRLKRCGTSIPAYSNEFFVNTNITRFSSNDNLLLPAARTNYAKLTALFSGISIWNSLPYEIKSASSVHTFQSLHKKYCLGKLCGQAH